MTYRHLFAPPRAEDFDTEPDPMGRPGFETLVERRAPDDDPGWDAAREDWMNGTPLTGIVGDNPFALHGSVGRDKQNRRGDVFKLQALLHREGHLDSEATGGPTGYWGNRDDAALRAFQKENGLSVDGYADPSGETIGKLKGFYRPRPSITDRLARPGDPPSFLQTREKKYDPHKDSRLILLNRSSDASPPAEASPAQYAQAQQVVSDAATEQAPVSQQPKPSASGWRVDEAGLQKIRDAERTGGYIGRDQERVALVQGVLPGIGQTKTWKQGEKINGMNDPPLEPGTAIATFKDGAYRNEKGYHAAIFLRYGVNEEGKEGVYVLDQWNGQPAHERHIRFDESAGSSSNNAGAFSAIGDK
jgi:peptidoglycan hydrolase-like protein with peptidoglycan-binding domain